MFDVPLVMVVLIAFALVFDFLNGFHDSSNIVATMIASRAMNGQMALTIAAIAHFLGPFLFGVAVATTVGHEILNEVEIKLSVTMAALIAAIVWNVVTWYFGIPSSSSHALVGGMLGAAVIESGWGVVKMAGVTKVLIALTISPIIGLTVGFIVMRTVLFLARPFPPSINQFFKRSQLVTALALSLSHGTNDAQKTMGVITMGLVSAGVLQEFYVPFWVIFISAAAIALGTWFGGWRLIKTLGGKFYKIRPIHGFTAQFASASVILSASLLGGPVSTTQVVSSAIMGVGSAERLSKVRWGVAGQIVTAWLTTIPAAALMSALVALVLRQWF